MLQGFLLTRQWRDTPNGIELSFWVKTKQGVAKLIIPRQQAVCFIRRASHLPVNAERKLLGLRTLQHEAVDGLYFLQQKSLNQLRIHLQYDKKQLLESDIKPTERYLMERFINASMLIHGEPEVKPGYLQFHSPRLQRTSEPIKPDLTWVSLDIETEDFKGRLYSIALQTPDDARVLMVRKPPPVSQIKQYDTIRIEWFDHEKDALLRLFDWFKQHDPDLILGWNVVGFDLHFLYRKCQQLSLSFTIGRDGQAANILSPQQQGQTFIARIPGRAVLDGIAVLRSATYHFDRYDLDFVAQNVLGKGKLITSESDQLAEIRRQYREDPIALAQYNLQDCELVSELFEHLNLIDFSIQRAEMTGLAIDRQGGSVAAFDHLYLPHLHRQGFVAPDVGSLKEGVNSPGGYVMRSKPGLYKNVLVLDFKSLYPSIIRTFKIDPLGLAIATEQQADDAIPGFLAANFSRQQHILPEMVSQLWQQRDLAKQHNNKALSQAIKIIMNSFYGVLGSSGCRFFNPQLASSITRRGHQIIQHSRDQIEQQGYPVIYGDTDSIFVWLGNEQDEQTANQTGTQLAKTLNIWWQQYLQTEYQLESCLEIEYETHYLDFLMPSIRGTANLGSKKRYAGTVREGDKIRLIFKGMETARSDWTALAKQFQQTLYSMVFNDEPYVDFIRQQVDKLWRGECDEQLVYSKRLRQPLNAYVASQPPHVKAARKMKKPGRHIRYVITLNGPEPLENVSSTLDYQHYVDKQLAPVADSILHFLETSFEKITQRQIDVFEQLLDR